MQPVQMDAQYRSHEIVLKEAELLASSPEAVAAWLKEQGRENRYFDDRGDTELELSLIERNDRLIDLALARYGVSEEVLYTLFNRRDEVLRSAVLANERNLKTAILRFWPFANETDDLGWIGGLTQIELEALFSNPALPDSFIADFFEAKGVWLELSAEQRFHAAWRLVKNLTNRTERDDFWDGWDDYNYTKVFDSARTFSERAEVTLPWANLLGDLYAKLAPAGFSNFDPIRTAERWRTGANSPERENEDNARGFLVEYQRVRCGLARLASSRAKYSKPPMGEILDHSDVAIRCGGYSALRFTPDEITNFFQKDGKLACRYFLQNEHIWTKEETRRAVRDACQNASGGEDYIVSLSSDFSRQEKRMRETHPDWFADELWEDLPQDKPPTESSMDELVNRITFAPEIQALRAKIQQLETAATGRFWLLLVILAIIIYRT